MAFIVILRIRPQKRDAEIFHACISFHLVNRVKTSKAGKGDDTGAGVLDEDKAMKCISVNLSKDIKELEIVPIADAHLGDPYSDGKMLSEKIKYISDNRSVYCILNGDIMNVALKSSVSDVYIERLTPMQQIVKAVNTLRPIRRKILAATSGNHENRTRKNDGIDVMRLVCRELDIEDRYAPESALLFLSFGESSGATHYKPIRYMIYCNHGSGGGRKEGAKAIRLADMACIVDADIYIHSHTHLPMVMKQAFYRTNTQKGAATLTDKLFVNTGAFLNYGGYGEQYEYKPASKDTPHIFLNGVQREMSARL